MSKRLVAGQTLVTLALTLLAAVAGTFPRVSGCYPYRPAEMLAFWMSFCLLLLGMRLTRSCLPPPSAPTGGSAPIPNAAGASLAVLVGVSICVFSLLNFLYSTLWGLHLLPEPLSSRNQLVPGIGVAWMAVPLVVAAACQIPLLLHALGSHSAEAPKAYQRASILYWLAVAASVCLLLFFVGASMASLIHLNALAAVVGVTLLEALIVAVVSLEQFLWSLPRTVSLPPPYTAR